MYSSDAQYMDFTVERDIGFAAIRDMQPLQRCSCLEVTPLAKRLVEFLKELFSRSLEVHGQPSYSVGTPIIEPWPLHAFEP